MRKLLSESAGESEFERLQRNTSVSGLMNHENITKRLASQRLMASSSCRSLISALGPWFAIFRKVETSTHLRSGRNSFQGEIFLEACPESSRPGDGCRSTSDESEFALLAGEDIWKTEAEDGLDDSFPPKVDVTQARVERPQRRMKMESHRISTKRWRSGVITRAVHYRCINYATLRQVACKPCIPELFTLDPPFVRNAKFEPCVSLLRSHGRTTT